MQDLFCVLFCVLWLRLRLSPDQVEDEAFQCVEVSPAQLIYHTVHPPDRFFLILQTYRQIIQSSVSWGNMQ